MVRFPFFLEHQKCKALCILPTLTHLKLVPFRTPAKDLVLQNIVNVYFANRVEFGQKGQVYSDAASRIGSNSSVEMLSLLCI